jgi:hypothetical protein
LGGGTMPSYVPRAGSPDTNGRCDPARVVYSLYF